MVKKVAVRVQNTLLAEGILAALEKNGEFLSYRLSPTSVSDTVTDCISLKPDIILMEISYSPEESIEKCLAVSTAVRSKLRECRIVFLCDDVSCPELARKTMLAKQDGKIDMFFFSSVDGKYLAAVLTVL